jgi:hypothetical protein
MPRALLLFSLSTSLLACVKPCMQTGYVRDARVTSEYQLVTSSPSGRTERRGFGPESMRMHLFNAFACSMDTTLPKTAPDSRFFYVDLGPQCRLMARADSHLRDTGRYASGAFIQSEAQLVEGEACSLTLDTGSVVDGKVKTGSMVIRPATVTLDVVLDVPGGAFHLAQTGTWEGGPRAQPTL